MKRALLWVGGLYNASGVAWGDAGRGRNESGAKHFHDSQNPLNNKNEDVSAYVDTSSYRGHIKGCVETPNRQDLSACHPL